MSQMQCPSADYPTGSNRPVTPHPVRTRSAENIPDYVVSPTPRAQSYLDNFDFPQEFIEETQPIFEDFSDAFEDSFERVLSQVAPRLPSPESQTVCPAPPPPEVCPGPTRPPSPLRIPPPPKDKKDRKAYIERAKAIHQKLLREGKVLTVAAPQVASVELPVKGKGKVRQPISRWPGGKPPGAAPKPQPVEGQAAKGKPARGKPTRVPTRGQPAPGQPSRGQPARGQPARGQPARGQSARGQPARGQPAKTQPTTKVQPPQTKGPRPPLKKPRMPLKPKATAPSTAKGKPKGSGPEILSPSHCAAIARARRLAGLKSTRPELNPAVAARIAAEKAEAERLAALPEFERIQERMERVRKTPATMRKRKLLSPTKMGTLQAIKITTPLTTQISEVCEPPTAPMVCPPTGEPQSLSPERLATLPPSSARKRPKRQLKYDTSPAPCPEPTITPLPQQRPWQPAVRKARHTDSRLWRKRFPRAFSGPDIKGSRPLDIMPSFPEEEECEVDILSEVEAIDAGAVSAYEETDTMQTMSEIDEASLEMEEVCEQMLPQSTGAVPRIPPSVETVAEWERMKRQAQMLMTPPATAPSTEEETIDEFEELEQMFEQIHGETPKRTPSPGVSPKAKTEALMERFFGSAGRKRPKKIEQLVVPPPCPTGEGVPAYIKLADLKHRQEIFQQQMEVAQAQALSDITEDISIDEVQQQYGDVAAGIDWSLQDLGPEEALTPIPTKYLHGAPQEYIQVDEIGTPSPICPLPADAMPAYYDFAAQPTADDEEIEALEDIEEIEQVEDWEELEEDFGDVCPTDLPQFESICPVEFPQLGEDELIDISTIDLLDESISEAELDMEPDYDECVEEDAEPTKPGFLASVVGTVVDTVKNIFAKPKDIESTDEEGITCIPLDSSLPNMFVEYPSSPEQQLEPAEEAVCPAVEEVVCPPVPTGPKPESPIIVPPPPKDKKDRKAFVERARAIHKLQQREAAKAPPPPPPETKRKKREVKSSIPKARSRAPVKRKPQALKKPKPKPIEYPPGFDAEHPPAHCAAVARARQIAGLKNTTLQLNPELHARIAAKKAAKLAEIEAKRKAREEELAAEAALPGPERYRARIQRLKREGQPPICPQPTLDMLGKLEAIRAATLPETDAQPSAVEARPFATLAPAERFKQLQLMREQAPLQAQVCPSYEDVDTTPPPYVPIQLESPKTDTIQRQRTILQVGSHGGKEVIKQTVVESSFVENGEVHTDVRTITTKTDEFGNVTCHVQEGTGQTEEENLENITELESLPEFLEDIPAPIDSTVPTPGEIIERIRQEVRNRLSSAITATAPTSEIAPPSSLPYTTEFLPDVDEEGILDVSELYIEEVCPQDDIPLETIPQTEETLMDTGLPIVFAATPPPPTPPQRAPSPGRVSPTVCPPQPRPPSPIVVPPPPKDTKDSKAFVARARAIHALKMREEAEAAAAGISTKAKEQPKKTKREPISRRPISRREKKAPVKKPAPSRGAQVASRKKGLAVKRTVGPDELRPLSPSYYAAIARARKLAGLPCTRPELNPELAAQIAAQKAAEKAEAERFAALSDYEKIHERMARLRKVPIKTRRPPPSLSPTVLGTLAGIRSTMPCPVPTETQPSPPRVQEVVVEPEPAPQIQPSPQRRERIVLPSMEREEERERYRDILEPKWKPKQRKYISPRSGIYRKRFSAFRRPKGKGTKALQVLSPVSEIAEEVCPVDEELDEFQQYEREIEDLAEFEAAEAAAELTDVSVQEVSAIESELIEDMMTEEAISAQPLEIPTFHPKYSSYPDWVKEHYQEEIQDFVQPVECVPPTDYLLEPYDPTAGTLERLRMIKESQERARISAAAFEELAGSYIEDTSAFQYAPLVLESPTRPATQVPSAEQLLIDIEGPQILPPRRFEDLEGCPTDIAFIEYEAAPDSLDFEEEPTSPPPSQRIDRIRKEVLERMQMEAISQPQPSMQPTALEVQPQEEPLQFIEPEGLPEEDICEVDIEEMEDICEMDDQTMGELDTSLPSMFEEPVPEELPPPPPTQRAPSPIRVSPTVCPPQPRPPSPIVVPPPPKDTKDSKAFVARARAIHALKMREEAEAAAAGISTKPKEQPKKKKREPISRRPISRREKKVPVKKPAPSRGAQVASRKKGLAVKRTVGPDELRPLSPSHYAAIARARKLAGLPCTRPELNPELAAQIAAQKAAEKAEAERFAALSDYEKIHERMARLRRAPSSQRKRLDVSPTVLGTLLGIRSTLPQDMLQGVPGKPMAPPCPQVPEVPIRPQAPEVPICPQEQVQQAPICPQVPQAEPQMYVETPTRAAGPLSARRRLKLDEPPSPEPTVIQAPPTVRKWQPAVRKPKHPRSDLWRKRFPRTFAGTGEKGSRPLSVMDFIQEDQVLEEFEAQEEEEQEDVCERPERPVITSVEYLPPLDMTSLQGAKAAEAQATEEVENIMAELDQWEKEYEQLEESFQAELAAIEGDTMLEEQELDEFLQLEQGAAKTELEELLDMEEMMMEQGDVATEEAFEVCEPQVEATEEDILDEFEDLEALYEGLEAEAPMRPLVQQTEEPLEGYIKSLEEQLEDVPCPMAPVEEEILDPRERYRRIVERQAARPPSPPSPDVEPEFEYIPLTLSSPTSGRIQTSTAQIISTGPSTIKEQIVETAEIENGELQQVVTQVVTTTDSQGNISYQVNQNRHVTAKDIEAEEDLCAMEEPQFIDITPDYIEERPRPADLIEKIRREVMEGRRPEGRPEAPTGILIDFGPTPPRAPQIVAQEDISTYTCPVMPSSPPPSPRRIPQRVSPVIQMLPTEIEPDLPEYFEVPPPTPPPVCPPTPPCPAKVPSPKPRAPSPIVVPPPPKDKKDSSAFVARARAIHALKMRQEAEAAAAGVSTKTQEQLKTKKREPISRRPISKREKKAPVKKTPVKKAPLSRGAQVASRKKGLGVKRTVGPDELRPLSPSHYEAIARARRLAGLPCTRPELNKEVAARIAAEKAEAERFATLSEYEKIQERMKKARTKGITRQARPTIETMAYYERMKETLPVSERYGMIRKRSPVPPTTQYPQLSPRSRYKRILEQPAPAPCPSPPQIEQVSPDFEPITLLSPERPGVAASLGATVPQFLLEDIESAEELQMMEQPSFFEEDQIDDGPLQAVCPTYAERPLTPIPTSVAPAVPISAPIQVPYPTYSERPLTPIPTPTDLPEEELLEYSLELLDYSLPTYEIAQPVQERAPSPGQQFATGQSLDISLPTVFEGPPMQEPVPCPPVTQTTAVPQLPTVIVEPPPGPPPCPPAAPIVVPPPPKSAKDREAFVKRARAIYQLQQQRAAAEGALCPPKPPGKPARSPISRRTGAPAPSKGRAPSAKSAQAVSKKPPAKQVPTKRPAAKQPPPKEPPAKQVPTRKQLKRPPTLLKKKAPAKRPVCPKEPPTPYPPGHIDAVLRARALAGIKSTVKSPSMQLAPPQQGATPAIQVAPPKPREPPTYESVMAKAAALRALRQPSKKLGGRRMAAAQRMVNLRQREERLATPMAMPAECVIDTTLTPLERFKAIQERQAVAPTTTRETSPVRTPPTVPFYVPPPRIELAESPSKISAHPQYAFEQPLLEEEAAPQFYDEYTSPVTACIEEATELNQNIAALHDQILDASKRRTRSRRRPSKRRLDLSQASASFLDLEQELEAAPTRRAPLTALAPSGFNVGGRISALENRLMAQQRASPPTPDYSGLPQFFATPPQAQKILSKVQRRPPRATQRQPTSQAPRPLPKARPVKQLARPKPTTTAGRTVPLVPKASRTQVQKCPPTLDKEKAVSAQISKTRLRTTCPKPQVGPRPSPTSRRQGPRASKTQVPVTCPKPQERPVSRSQAARMPPSKKMSAPRVTQKGATPCPRPQIPRPQTSRAARPQVSRSQVSQVASCPQVTRPPIPQIVVQAPQPQVALPQVPQMVVQAPPPQPAQVPIQQMPQIVLEPPTPHHIPMPQVPMPQVPVRQRAQVPTCPKQKVTQVSRPQVTKTQVARPQVSRPQAPRTQSPLRKQQPKPPSKPQVAAPCPKPQVSARPPTTRPQTPQVAPTKRVPVSQVSQRTAVPCPKPQSRQQVSQVTRTQVTCPRPPVSKAPQVARVPKPQTSQVPICPKPQISRPQGAQVPRPQVAQVPRCPKPQAPKPQGIQVPTCPKQQVTRPQVPQSARTQITSTSQTARQQLTQRVPRTASAARACKPTDVAAKRPWR